MPQSDYLSKLQHELTQWSAAATADYMQKFGVPSRWLQMEQEHGTQAAIERILSSAWREEQWVPVLTHLWEHGRLHFSVEAAALRFPDLFTEPARAEAKRRLAQFGYSVEAT